MNAFFRRHRRYNPTPKQEAKAFLDGIFASLLKQKVLTKAEVPLYRKEVEKRVGKRVERIFAALKKLESGEMIMPFVAPAPASGNTYSEQEWENLARRMDTIYNPGGFEYYNAYHYHLLTKNFFPKIDKALGMSTVHYDWQNVIFEPVLERVRAMPARNRTPARYTAMHEELVERLHQWETAIVELDESEVFKQIDLKFTPKQISALRSAYLSPFARNTVKLVEGLLQNSPKKLRYWSMNRKATRDLIEGFLAKNLSWKQFLAQLDKAGR